jgi:DNA excision repair protein ERCC-4
MKYNQKYHKGQHRDSKEAKRAKLKLEKMEKYDPEANANTSTLQQMRNSAQQASVPPIKHVPISPNGSKSDDGTNTSGLSRIEILREKLRAKIAEKAAKSGSTVQKGTDGATGNSDASAISKRAARRAEKERRIEEAKKRKAAAEKSGGISKAEKHSRTKMEIDGESNLSQSSGAKNAAMSDDIANIDYGTLVGLDTSDDAINKDYMSANKSMKKQKKKSLERLMEEAEQKKSKLNELKEKARQGDSEAAEKVSKMQWSDTLQSATGEKVHLKNDPQLLKKAIKRKQKKKERSATKWNARLETQADAMKERQSIRDHNIGQRKIGGAAGANLSKKRMQDKEGQEIKKDADDTAVKSKKRPRLGPHSGKNRAGFEGKKTGFLNKD